MGKLKPRIKAGKSKKWRKGQSSSSNPSTTKYREAAKSRFFTPNLGTSRALTVGALKTHNAISYGGKPRAPSTVPSDDGESDVVSEGTTATFASNFSTCSNVSFSKLLNNFQPSSALHKEMLAVLSAVTEVIKEKGGEESTTEYFAALMTALDGSDTAESTAGIVSLLLMGIKRVPAQVLRAKFSHISKSFLDILSKYSEGDYFVIMRCVIGCLAVVLAAQDTSVWSYPSTHQLFHTLLLYTTFTKPKVRKAAQHAVRLVLTKSEFFTEDALHPAAIDAANFCVTKLEDPAVSTNSALHVLVLLKDIISTFPKTHIKKACEAMLKLLTIGNAVMTACCMEALHGLVSSSTPVTRLTPTLTAQLIHAIYDYQPSIADAQSLLAWLTVLHNSYSHLAKIDAQICCENFVKLFTKVRDLWLCDNSKILANATHTLRTVALDTLPLCRHCTNFTAVVQNIFCIVEEGLLYQYHNAWPHVLNVIAALFEGLGPAAAEIGTGSCLVTLAQLRDSHDFAYIAELEFAVGRAIRALGPEPVLKCIPLQITGDKRDMEVTRGWMLPVLKDNVKAAPLSYFTQHILPVALLCRKKSEELEKKGEKAGAHTYELLCCQLWALLPCFGSHADSIAKHLPAIAPTMGAVLQGNKSLRTSVMAALRRLLQTCKESKEETGITMIGKYAKNFLPMLFNIYTTKPNGTDEEGHRLAAFDTIKAYVADAAPEQLCCELFDKAVEHVSEGSEVDAYMKTAVMDLLKILLIKLDSSRITRLYDLSLHTLQLPHKSYTEEKKAYRLLEQLCACESETCRSVMATKVSDIRKRVLRAVKKQNSSNAGARLRVIRLLLPLLPPRSYNVIKTLVPEAVLRCKDINSRTRACAFDVLMDMFHVSQKWTDKPEGEMAGEFLVMLVGGLSGSSTLVSATILALSHLTYMLRATLPEDMQRLLLQSATMLLAESSREVVAAALGFMKTYLTAFPPEKILPHAPLIVESLSSMQEDCARHARLKTRDVLDRLIRKCGYETVKQFIPQDDVIMHKRLNNLRKISQSKRKRSDERSMGDDDDHLRFNVNSKHNSIEDMLDSSDESEEEEERKSSRLRGATHQMCIREDETDILDLTSPAAARNLSVKKIVKAVPEEKSKSSSSAFEFTSTGKLVIPRNIADDTRKRPPAESEDDNSVDDVTSELSCVAIGSKRKMSVASGSVRSGPPAKYHAGGGGIHRVVSTHSKSGSQKRQELDADIKTGKEYRAKKARGDVKLKGKPDPYAYIPLSRKLLNKRNKAKASGRLNNIFKSAVKGAKAGARRRRTNK